MEIILTVPLSIGDVWAGGVSPFCAWPYCHGAHAKLSAFSDFLKNKLQFLFSRCLESFKKILFEKKKKKKKCSFCPSRIYSQTVMV